MAERPNLFLRYCEPGIEHDVLGRSIIKPVVVLPVSVLGHVEGRSVPRHQGIDKLQGETGDQPLQVDGGEAHIRVGVRPRRA